jgi:hypothetical protein
MPQQRPGVAQQPQQPQFQQATQQVGPAQFRQMQASMAPTSIQMSAVIHVQAQQVQAQQAQTYKLHRFAEQISKFRAVSLRPFSYNS